jgi:hypothetical protein
LKTGSIDVEDANVEGTTTLNSEAIYKDIEDVAKIISFKRIENAAYGGVARFYREIAAAQEQAAQEQAQAEPTI